MRSVYEASEIQHLQHLSQNTDPGNQHHRRQDDRPNLALPSDLIAFNSSEGEELLLESDAKVDFWNLSMQFVTHYKYPPVWVEAADL